MKVLPDLTGSARSDVLAALFEGPYACEVSDGPLPKPLVDAVTAEAEDVAERQHSGWVDEKVQSQVLDVLDRAAAGEGGTTVPTKFADAAWGTRYSQVRTALLVHAGVTAARKQRWLRDVNEPGLGALLKPGTEQAVIDLALAEVRRRTPTDSTYTAQRAASPAAPEELLSNHPVAETALRGLCLLLPEEPARAADESTEQRMLRERWQTLIVWIARAQVHLWRQVTDGNLLERSRPVDADGQRQKLTEEELAQARHLLRLRYPWNLALPGVLDLIPDEELERVVRELLDDAGRNHLEANWWAEQQRRLAEAGAEWVPGSAEVDAAFERYLLMRDESRRMRESVREERNRKGLEPLSAEEEDQKYAKHLEHVRWWFDEQSEDGPGKAAESTRGMVSWTLAKALPVLAGRARPSVRPSESVYDQRQGVWPSDRPWAASTQTRERLARHVRTAVHEFVLPYPPDMRGYGAGDWAELAQASLRSEDDVALVPAEVRKAAKDAAQEWVRYHRSNHRTHGTLLAMEAVVKALSTPPPVEPRKSSRDVALETLATLEATLQRTKRYELTRQDVDAAVDAALDVAVVNWDLHVDDVLAVVRDTSGPGGGVADGDVDDVVTAAVVRLAGRLEEMLRAAPGQVSPSARSQAARAVLQSSVLPVDAVLALPAFAVFGSEAVSSGAAGAPGWRGVQDGERPGERWRQLLVDLVDPTGEDPGAWDRLAGQDVENKGRDAWRSVRAVLADARINAAHPARNQGK